MRPSNTYDSGNVHPQPPNNTLHPNAAKQTAKGQQKKTTPTQAERETKARPRPTDQRKEGTNDVTVDKEADKHPKASPEARYPIPAEPQTGNRGHPPQPLHTPQHRSRTSPGHNTI